MTARSSSAIKMSYERESVKALEIGIHVAWRSEFSGSRSSWAQLVFITVYSAKMCINPVFRKVGLSQKIRRSGKKFPDNKKVNLGVVRTNVLEYIQKEHPELDESKNIALSELYEYRGKYMEQSLREEFNNLSLVEKEILEKMKSNETVSTNLENDLKDSLTLGQKIADKIASFGGSWKFIILFFIIIMIWMSLNIIPLMFKSFDPYPFILLNLVLSCLAAFQAPIIMMSQNRQADKDRLHAQEDYKVNLKAELEIQILQEKLDHLILVQQQKMFEVQNLQIDMLREITNDVSEIKCRK